MNDKSDSTIKIYLNLVASTRSELSKKIGSEWFTLNNQHFHISEVFAENTANGTASGAMIGGFVGALAGPLGILVGGILGGAIGNSNDDEQKVKVESFNNSIFL